MAQEAKLLDPFEKRPGRIISQAGLFDAVEVLAVNVNTLSERMDRQEAKLDLILEILHGRTQSS
jgi:hypothetical protein